MPFLSFGKNKKQKAEPDQERKVFSILLSQKTIQALFWVAFDSHIEIVSQSSLKYYFDENDCLIKLDECLQELGPESESVSLALFHLDTDLSDQAGLLPSKKDFLQHLTQTLSLNSIGVAANTEALAQVISQDVPKPYNLIIEFTSNKESWSIFTENQLVWQKDLQYGAELDQSVANAWEEVKIQLPPQNLEQNLSVLLVSSIYNRSEILNKSDGLPISDIETEYIGANEILEKVVPPSAVALAKEKGWITEILQPATDENHLDQEDFSEQDASPEQEGLIQENELKNEADFLGESLELESENGILNQESKSKKKSNWPLIAFLALSAGIITTLLVLIYSIGQKSIATLQITPKEQPLQKSTEIKINPNLSQSDFVNLILAGQLEKQNLTESGAIPVTGKKKIGEKSKGKVELINKKSTTEKKFPQGTILSDGTSTFILNNDITISGASTEEKNGETIIKHSKAEANVTAVNPGEEGNIKIGAKLKIGDFNTSDYEAEATANFEGGSSKTITVATETDQKNIQDQLLAKIIEEAAKNLKMQNTTGKYLIPLTKSAKVKEKDWSVGLDEETDELGLKLTVTLPVISYAADDLKPLAQAVLNKELPSGYSLSEEEPQLMSAASSEQKEGEPIKLQVDVRSTAIANVPTEGMSNQVVGLEIPQAISKLKNIPGIAEINVSYNNDWYERFFSKLPKNSNQIRVQLNENQSQ